MNKKSEIESASPQSADAAARAKVIRQRNLVMAIALAGMAVLFFLITIAKIRH